MFEHLSLLGELSGNSGPDLHRARGAEVSGIFTTVTPSQLAQFNTLFLSWITLIFKNKNYLFYIYWRDFRQLEVLTAYGVRTPKIFVLCAHRALRL